MTSFFPTVSDVLYYASVFFTVLSGANYVIKNRDVISYETADQN